MHRSIYQLALLPIRMLQRLDGARLTPKYVIILVQETGNSTNKVKNTIKLDFKE
jgi:hypothetical protein